MKTMIRISALLFISLWARVCAGPAPAIRTMTVSQIWEAPLAVSNQTLRVRGRAEFLIWQTLQLCDPPTCDCNRSGGRPSLLDGEDVESDSSVNRQQTIWVSTSETGLQCAGNECELVCRPFDPQRAEAFELVGRLRVQSINPNAYHLILDNLDIEASRQLIDGNWVPIPTETVTITLRTP